jgi:arginyl-tRNA synthetase
MSLCRRFAVRLRTGRRNAFWSMPVEEQHLATTGDRNTDPPGPVRTQLMELVERALEGATRSGALPRIGDADRPPIEIGRPANAEHGDYATSVALKLARPMRRSPLAIAEALASSLRDGQTATDAEGMDIAAVTVAPLGFVNFRLEPPFVAKALESARAAGPAFGRVQVAQPQRINVEFVSANPTGPLTIGNARGAFTGDLLSRLLEAAGHQITREYYFNDSGAQVRNLGDSILAIRLGLPIPEDGYRGDYVQELARDLPEDVWAQANAASDAEKPWVVGRWAAEHIRAGIESSLSTLGVRFDVWTTERSLHAQGWVDRALAQLRRDGYLYEQDGATWFRSTAFGDDKDRVVIRSNGEPTYVASDIGYLAEKFSRGFERLLYLWGQDHHGTVARLRNAAEALGYGKDRVEMILMAWVRFVRDGQEIPMSKRSGEFLTLDELLAEIGVDAARWFFGARSHNSGIDFDLELAKRQSNENPVYYVQYAHARISSILRKAADAGLSPADSIGSLGDDPVSLGLAKEVIRLPEVIEDAALAGETQGITAYATELATTFHAYYRDRRVVDPADPETSGGRLALVDATRLALANSLGLLGISAPESM